MYSVPFHGKSLQFKFKDYYCTIFYPSSPLRIELGRIWWLNKNVLASQNRPGNARVSCCCSKISHAALQQPLLIAADLDLVKKNRNRLMGYFALCNHTKENKCERTSRGSRREVPVGEALGKDCSTNGCVLQHGRGGRKKEDGQGKRSERDGETKQEGVL